LNLEFLNDLNVLYAPFDRALKLNPDLGDHWALKYNFELKYGTLEQQEIIIIECKLNTKIIFIRHRLPNK